MARCKLTNMNLRNIRKTREYQCLLIDLVKTGVVGKSAAEGLLGYTIPEGLLDGTTPVTPPDDEDEEPRLITIAAKVLDGESNLVYDTFEYDLNDGDTAEDILTAAKDHWAEAGEFNAIKLLLETDGGTITIDDKSYDAVPVVAESFEPGAIYKVSFAFDGEVNPGRG